MSKLLNCVLTAVSVFALGYSSYITYKTLFMYDEIDVTMSSHTKGMHDVINEINKCRDKLKKCRKELVDSIIRCNAIIQSNADAVIQSNADAVIQSNADENIIDASFPVWIDTLHKLNNQLIKSLMEFIYTIYFADQNITPVNIESYNADEHKEFILATYNKLTLKQKKETIVIMNDMIQEMNPSIM